MMITPCLPRRLVGRDDSATTRRPECGKSILQVLMSLSSSLKMPSSISPAAWLNAFAHIEHASMYSSAMSCVGPMYKQFEQQAPATISTLSDASSQVLPIRRDFSAILCCASSPTLVCFYGGGAGGAGGARAGGG